MIKLRNTDGFTLIELLIVIVILGILAGIVVFAVGNASSDATDSACQADRKTLERALEAYKVKASAYPADLSLLTGTTSGGPFLKLVPTGWTTDGSGGLTAPSGC